MPSPPLPMPRTTLPWPLPALLVWTGAWCAFAAFRWGGAPDSWPLLAGAAAGAALALLIRPRWRRMIAAAGFPLSAALAAGAAAIPSGLWLLALLPLAALYPLRAWRDAPFFPTPTGAMAGIDAVVVPAPRRVLDAGCGLGHGLIALRIVWPDARFEGVEWSRPLARVAAWRCRWARVQRGDMWQASWAGNDLVYLFQRPESMTRAYAKATAELPAGAWLVSLEFAVPGVAPWSCLRSPDHRPVWVYRMGQTP
jgi:hypothetical protein